MDIFKMSNESNPVLDAAEEIVANYFNKQITTHEN